MFHTQQCVRNHVSKQLADCFEKLSSVQLKAFRKVERFNKGYLKSLANIKLTNISNLQNFVNGLMGQ